MEDRKKAWEMLAVLNQVILGKEAFIQQMMTALLAGGHVLLEDIPGVGKTTMALAFSKVLGLTWNRVQFTPDVLPSDLTGYSIYKKEEEAFCYCPGAVFCNLLLADEINRTSPKTQSALLEVMEEKQVTVDGVTRSVPEPFCVIATQNPLGSAGTQMLPPAQMDRFMVCLNMGYPDFENEIQMAKGMHGSARTSGLSPVVSAGTFLQMQQKASQLFMHDDIYRYIVTLISETRKSPFFSSGASPRGTIALVRMAKASAWLKGRDFVTPQDVSEQFLAVTNHRVHLNAKARMEQIQKEDILTQIQTDTVQPQPGR